MHYGQYIDIHIGRSLIFQKYNVERILVYSVNRSPLVSVDTAPSVMHLLHPPTLAAVSLERSPFLAVFCGVAAQRSGKAGERKPLLSSAFT